MAAHIGTAHTSRLRTMVVPREHGAWGMLLVPLATGAVAAAGRHQRQRARAFCCRRDVALLAAHPGRELAGHLGNQGAYREERSSFCA